MLRDVLPASGFWYAGKKAPCTVHVIGIPSIYAIESEKASIPLEYPHVVGMEKSLTAHGEGRATKQSDRCTWNIRMQCFATDIQ